VTKREISWPQYFAGQQQTKNELAQAFGIDSIPHLFLVDKTGRLRLDNVDATQADFGAKIEILLAE
jgi:hypothetical protein